MHVFDHTIKPILLYGSDIWGMFNPFTMKCKKRKHGVLERYNSLVSLYTSFNSGNSFPRFSKPYQYNNMPLIMLKYNGNLPSSDNTAMLVVMVWIN
jgi:hypothetical protein